jgi:hypothetical protein
MRAQPFAPHQAQEHSTTASSVAESAQHNLPSAWVKMRQATLAQPACWHFPSIKAFNADQCLTSARQLHGRLRRRSRRPSELRRLGAQVLPASAKRICDEGIAPGDERIIRQYQYSYQYQTLDLPGKQVVYSRIQCNVHPQRRPHFLAHFQEICGRTLMIADYAFDLRKLHPPLM